MHYAILAWFADLAGIYRHRSSRIDDNDAALLDGFGTKLNLLLVDRCAAQVWNPMIEE